MLGVPTASLLLSGLASTNSLTFFFNFKLLAACKSAEEISFTLSLRLRSLVEVVRSLTKLSTFWFKAAPRSTEYSLAARIWAKSSSSASCVFRIIFSLSTAISLQVSIISRIFSFSWMTWFFLLIFSSCSGLRSFLTDNYAISLSFLLMFLTFFCSTLSIGSFYQSTISIYFFSGWALFAFLDIYIVLKKLKTKS